jgi:glycosyltransferase involved in cell wall biosynthesis
MIDYFSKKKEFLKIAVNTRLLIKNKLDGIGWFSYETLRRITIIHKDVEFIFLFDRQYDKEFIFSPNIRPVILHPQSRHPFLYIYWMEVAVKNFLQKEKPDLFLSTDGYLSLSSNIPSLPVIHDINFHHRPQDLPVLTRNYYNYFFPRFAKKARRIATVSEYSKYDISNSYGIAPDRIDVVYNGASDVYLHLPNFQKQQIKNTYTQGCDFFVFIGSLHPRKNVPSLLKAFDEFKHSTGNDFKLIIIGDKMFLASEIERTLKAMKYSQDVIFTGRLPQDDLQMILGSAFALTFVPLFEGFGIPIVEAMYSDVPVICSNVTSMPEVAGDAALYADPYSIDSIRDAMVRITVDSHLRETLIEKGCSQRLLFSWDKTSRNLWNSIEKSLCP